MDYQPLSSPHPQIFALTNRVPFQFVPLSHFPKYGLSKPLYHLALESAIYIVNFVSKSRIIVTYSSVEGSSPLEGLGEGNYAALPLHISKQNASTLKPVSN